MSIRQFQAQRIHAPREFQPIAQQPICIEIGAGKGKHALLRSQQYPESQLIAIERTREKFLAMQKLHQQAALSNLQVIHADAIAWTVHALYPAQAQQIFILYPNPEPHNPAQRWLNMPFFEFLLSRLAPNGQITLASNIPEYIEEAAAQLNSLWKLPFEQQVIGADSARTHFEIKYLERGELCQQLLITKPADYHTRFDDFMPLLGQDVAKAAVAKAVTEPSDLAVEQTSEHTHGA